MKLHRLISVVTFVKGGDNMKVGFIGAGKAGCSLGKYFSDNCDMNDLQVTGYYSLYEEEARWAAVFTNSTTFECMDDVITASDAIIFSTPDGAIKNVWDSIDKDYLQGKIIGHLSGSLSSDVFSGIEDYGAYAISIHPLFAFSDKESAYQQLNDVCFTLEGDSYAVSKWQCVLEKLGNASVEISKEVKPAYHAAASIVSNHVISVLHAGYKTLEMCGFSEAEARRFTSNLIRYNVEHVITDGCVDALTGPIERGDVGTVEKHLDVIDESFAGLYRVCGEQLLELAKDKNPERDYKAMEQVLRDR